MDLTLAEALTESPLNHCKVAAGYNGLNATISSVNSFDAPDVLPWLKVGELVLTSGYIFKNDELALVNLIQELANRKCAGLGIKTSHFQNSIPDEMRMQANELNFPIIEIPDELSIADLVLTVLKRIFAKQNKNDQRDRKRLFFTRLLSGEIIGKDLILSEGRSFGLNPGSSYICLCVEITPKNSKYNTFHILQKTLGLIEEKTASLGLSVITVEITEILIFIQSELDEGAEKLHLQALQLANNLIDLEKLQDWTDIQLTVSIGTSHSNVLGIRNSFLNAKEALQLGGQLFPHSGNRIYDHKDLKNYSLLQHIPYDLLVNYYTELLNPLIRHDKENQSDLLETLYIYLTCCGRPTETSQLMGVHRNTIHHRISRIKELIKTDLDDGETLFRLNLALRIYHLLK